MEVSDLVVTLSAPVELTFLQGILDFSKDLDVRSVAVVDAGMRV